MNRRHRATGQCSAQAGWTLVEMCVTIAVAALLLSLSLRMVFLTDRAMDKTGRAAGGNAEAMAVAAAIAADIRMAQAVEVGPGGSLALRLVGEESVDWRVTAKGMTCTRSSGTETHDGLQLVGLRAAPDLVEFTVTDTSGARLATAVRPRNLTGGRAL